MKNSKIRETVTRFPNTDIWNDSCSKKELEYAIERGGVGATTNPIIVSSVIKQEMDTWHPVILDLIRDNPCDSETEITWKLIETIGAERSKMLLPIYQAFQGKKGRLSMQTNPQFYRNPEAMAAQAVHFHSLAENMQVKIPASAAGIKAIEEATYQGVSINATVSYTLSQAIAVAEAVERGLKRREAEGLPTQEMAPICTIMLGRLDDWLKKYTKNNDIVVNPESLEWAGVAVFKKAYRVFKERGYRTRLLTAAYRNHRHWSQLIGGDASMTIPHAWLRKIDNCDIEVKCTIHDPVPEYILNELMEKVPEFVKAYDEDGLSPEEFVYYGAFQDTIKLFIEGYSGLLATIREIMVYER